MLGVVFSSFTIHFLLTWLGFHSPLWAHASILGRQHSLPCPFRWIFFFMLVTFVILCVGYGAPNLKLFIVFMVQNNWHCHEVHSATMHVHWLNVWLLAPCLCGPILCEWYLLWIVGPTTPSRTFCLHKGCSSVHMLLKIDFELNHLASCGCNG
jgi:hypothetical protein